MELPFSNPRRSLPPAGSPTLARWLVPPAALLALSGLAGLQSDAAAAAESRFLALLVAGVLAAVAALASAAPRSAWPLRELAATALLATAAGWIAYHGPSRGAVVTLILSAGLALAVARAVRHPHRHGLGPEVTVPAAIAVQLLLRSDLLLPPLLEARTLVSVLALPAAAGAAVSLLGLRFGAARALVAGGTAAVLAPGFNVTSTLGLVALGLGTVLVDRQRPRWMRRLAATALVLGLAWNPPLGAVATVAGLTMWAGEGGRRSAVAAALLASLAAVLLVVSPDGGRPALALWVSGMTVLPALVLAPADGRWRVVHGLLLALLAAQLGDRPGALAAGLALAALGTPVRGAAAGLQHAWSGTLLAGTTLLATYPWMRAAPRADLMALLGVRPSGVRPSGLGDELFALALLAGSVALLAPLLDLATARAPVGRDAGTRRTDGLRLPPFAPQLLVALVAGLAVVRTAGPSTVLLDSYGAAALDGQRRQWRTELASREVSTVVLDTNLVHAVALAAGTPVATVKLHDPEGRQLAAWELAAGTDTAEWAAARPDIAGRPGFTAPPPWISRLAPDGTFFARRFRSRLAVDTPAAGASPAAAAVTIDRAHGLPSEVRLVIYRLELRP